MYETDGLCFPAFLSFSLCSPLQPLLPSSLSVEDAAMLLQQVMRPFGKHTAAVVFSDTVVVSEKFLTDCTALFSERMHQKAEKVFRTLSRLPILTALSPREHRLIASGKCRKQCDRPGIDHLT